MERVWAGRDPGSQPAMVIWSLITKVANGSRKLAYSWVPVSISGLFQQLDPPPLTIRPPLRIKSWDLGFFLKNFENFRKILKIFEKNRKKLIQKIKLSENSKNEVNFLNFRAPKARERKFLTKIHQNDHFLCDFSTYKHQISDFKTSKFSACGGLQFATKKYPDFGMPKSTFLKIEN